MNKRVNVVMMTALVPTIGHQFLIDFVLNFTSTTRQDETNLLIISTRDGEPTTFEDRRKGLATLVFRVVEHHDNSAPQNPSTDAEWDYWRKVVIDCIEKAGLDRNTPVNNFFASELYGEKMAELLGARFIPVDIGRENLPVKGEDVRKSLGCLHWHPGVSPLFEEQIRQHVVLFGPESCGKTTMSLALDRYSRVPEWARGYLETVGPEITLQKMDTIVKGQRALEIAARKRRGTLLVFYDTDLLSTLGYYRLKNFAVPTRLLDYVAENVKKNFYIVMNDQIPFTPDQLRYGGDKRETNVQYWVDLLEEFEANYYIVKSINFDEQYEEILDLLIERKLPGKNFSLKDLETYVRD